MASRAIRTPPSTRVPRAKKARSTGLPKLRRAPLYQVVRGNSSNGPWPERKKCSLVFVNQTSVSLTSGAGQYVYSCNGMYDPDITGVGNQPLYFDQLASIYDHFVVTKSVMELQVLGSASRNLILTFYIDDDGTDGVAYRVAAQRPTSKVVGINPGVTTPPKFYQTWDGYKTFGPNILNNTLYRGSSLTNPSEQSFFFVKINDLDLGAEAVDILVRITYECTWSEFASIAGS